MRACVRKGAARAPREAGAGVRASVAAWDVGAADAGVRTLAPSGPPGARPSDTKWDFSSATCGHIF